MIYYQYSFAKIHIITFLHVSKCFIGISECFIMLHITNKITFGTNLLLYLHYILINNDITNMNHYRNVIIAFAVLLCTNVSAQNGKEYLMRKKAVKIISEMTVDEKINQLMNETPAIEHLGIKPYDWWSEGLHGVGRDGRATVFPQPIGLGATFDPMLVKNIGDA